MAETDSTTNRLPVHTDVRYEHSDISSRNIFALGVGILIGTWLCIWLLYYFFEFLVHYREAAGPAAAVRSQGKVLVPPEPRIQASPPADLHELLSSENAQLHSYGWVDRANGIVSIPIENAIELTAQKGIPPLHSPLKVCDKNSPTWQAGVGGIADPTMICPPKAGTRETGLEGSVEPEPR